MQKMSEVSHKYSILAQIMIKNQQEYRRHSALARNDQFAWMKAQAETVGRSTKLAMEIEDIVFDYFGIISI
jgi:hypothetical protein